jgi:molybdate transport system substrate-binding protein
MGHTVVRQTSGSRRIRFPSPTSVIGWALIILLLGACASPGWTNTADSLLVSAASSLILAFEEVGTRYEDETGTQVTFNFAASGQLAQQIEQGAPVDLFLSANRAYVEDLAAKGYVLPDSVQSYARGRLTLWTRADSSLSLETMKDLLKPEVRRVAIANPEHAPYGVAARQALQTAGVWDSIEYKLVPGENVRQALQYAETGNVDAAIIPLSLSITSQGNWTLIPEDLHTPIDQALGVVADSPRQAQAQDFADFIVGPQGQAILQEYGFMPSKEISSP